MNNFSLPVRVSLRQADGQYYPVFRYGGSETRNLSLLPVLENQDEARIPFYYHPKDGSGPVSLGLVQLTGLPVDGESIELRLEAVINSEGQLSLMVSHQESGRTERLEVSLPREKRPARSVRRQVLKWIFGVLFVAAGAALIVWLITLVAGWGWQEPVEAPLSLRSALSLVNV